MGEAKKTKGLLLRAVAQLRRRVSKLEGTGEQLQLSLARVRQVLWGMKDSQQIAEVLQAIYGEVRLFIPQVYGCSVEVLDSEDNSAESYQISKKGIQKIHTAQAQPFLVTTWRAGQVVYRPDLQAEDPYGEAAAIWTGYGPAIRAVVDVPFHRGTLAVNSLEPNAFSPEHIAVLEALAQVLSEGFQRMEDIQLLEQRNQELQREVAERRQAEAVVKESEERFRQLVENIDSVFWIINAERTQGLYLSPAYERIWGSSRQSVYENSIRWQEGLHPADRERVVAGLARMAGGGYDESYRIVRPDNGAVRWVRTRAFPIRDESGKVYRIAGITTDITQARRQEEQQEIALALQRVRNEILQMERQEDWEKVALACRRELDALVRFAQCSIVLVDLQQGTGRAYYCPVPGEVRVSSYTQVHPLLVRAVERQTYAYRRTRAEIARGEERIPLGIGSVIDLPFASGTLAVNSAEENAFGEREISILEQFAQVMSEAHRRLKDLQALEKKETQLRQSQKLEAIGQLAGGMAHDFNNLLTIINGYGEVLQRLFAAQDPGSEYLQEIQKAADRGAGLVRQLLAFSRRQVLQPEVLNLNAVIAELSKMLQRLIGEHIELHLGLDPGLEQVKADRGQLEQVLLNLVVNARDAMPQGGRLSIETGNAALEPGYARQQVAVQPGAYALLRVSDTGVGMEEEIQARIFEPFFTTKEPGKGTGLGLATVYGIVKQSGGYIWVRSAPGQGATFEVYLPCAAEEVRQTAGREEVDQASLQGGETLLLVEDEEPVRRLMVVALREQGYTVLEAGNGDEALQAAGQGAGPIHLLVTDVVMPGMNGRQLAERLGGRHPEMKVLYVTGYTEGIIEEQGVLAPQVAMLRKPFTLDSLALKIRQVLGSAR